jgi:hypothetical protein
MRLQKFTAASAVFAASAAMAAFATGAQAAVIDNDPINLSATTTGFSESLKATESYDWTQAKITPQLIGSITYQGANACYRVRIDSYDRNNNLLDTQNGPSFCSTDPNSHTRSFDITGSTQPLLYGVTVALQEKGGQGGWQTYASTNYSHVNTHDDNNVNVAYTNYTIGGLVQWGLDPTNHSMGEWKGSLTLAGATDPARVSLRYLDEMGNQVDRVDGPKIKPDSAGNYFSREDLSNNATPSTSALEMQIVLQTYTGGNWVNRRSTTVAMAE